MTPRITEAARAYREKLYPGSAATLYETDPEFVELFANFAFDEVVNAEGAGGGNLDDRTRFLAILSALDRLPGRRGVQGARARRARGGREPVALKELVYQSMAYVGFGRMLPFLLAANEVLGERGECLPLRPRARRRARAAARPATRAGGAVRRGPAGSWTRGPEDRRPVSAWLAGELLRRLVHARRPDAGRARAGRRCACWPRRAAASRSLTGHALGNLRAGQRQGAVGGRRVAVRRPTWATRAR